MRLQFVERELAHSIDQHYRVRIAEFSHCLQAGAARHAVAPRALRLHIGTGDGDSLNVPTAGKDGGENATRSAQTDRPSKRLDVAAGVDVAVVAQNRGAYAKARVRRVSARAACRATSSSRS